MKKILLSIAAMTLGMSAFAGEVTFDFTKSTYGVGDGQVAGESNTTFVTTLPAVMTNGDVTVTLNAYNESGNKWRFWTDGLRAYSAGAPYFTVATTNGEKVTGIKWSVKTGATFALAENQGGTLSSSGWIGSEESVTLNYTGSSNFAIISLTVSYGDTQLDIPTIPQYTVAEAIANASDTPTEIKVSGVVSSVSQYNATTHSITYYIKDNLQATESLQIYSGKGLNGQDFTQLADLVEGTQVVIQGNLKLYNGSPELDQGNYLLSFTYPEGYEPPALIPAPTETLTVAQAVNDYILKGYSGDATVKGVITDIQEVSAQYGNATYTIKDNEASDVSLLIYRGYGLDGEKFKAEEDLKVGAIVEVQGTIVLYNDTTPEMTTGSKILTYTLPESGVSEIELDANAPAVFYNLQGVKVDNPTKGIYIVNGKKVVIK